MFTCLWGRMCIEHVWEQYNTGNILTSKRQSNRGKENNVDDLYSEQIQGIFFTMSLSTAAITEALSYMKSTIPENLACFLPAVQLTSLQTRVLKCWPPTSKPALHLLKTFFTYDKASFQLLTIYLWKSPFNCCRESGLSYTISSIVNSLNNGFRINVT